MAWKTDGKPGTPPSGSDSSSSSATLWGVAAFALGLGLAALYLAQLTWWDRERDIQSVEVKRHEGVDREVGRRPTTFDLDGALVAKSEIRVGGPPIDGIPALTRPLFVSASKSAWKDSDRVIGFVADGQAKAYPLPILNHHEIVNDVVGDEPIVVVYCPLCDSATVFSAAIDDQTLEFGVTGRLYNSNVLLYNRGSDSPSLWSQLEQRAISGEWAGRQLTCLAFDLTTWGEWRNRHPTSLVMSPDTGHHRDYGFDPYGGYFASPELAFPVNREDPEGRLPAKERVLGIWTEGQSKAYPIAKLLDQEQIEDTIGGKKVRLRVEPSAQTVVVEQSDPGVQWHYGLWFAWYAAHPDTVVFSQNAAVTRPD